MISYFLFLILSGSILASGERCNIPSYVKIADATNCAGYLQCLNSQVRHQFCIGGTLFNSLTRLCDFPFNVHCGSRPINGSTPIITTAPPRTTQTTPTPTTLSPRQKETLQYYDFWFNFHCSHFGAGPIIRWPHPFDCTMYFECKDQKLVLKTCPRSPATLYYQFEKQNCVIKRNANCPIVPPFGERFVPSAEETHFRKICESNPNSLMRWPYSNDCRRFFQCTYGKFTQEVCSLKPNIMVYSDNILNCRPLSGNDTCILNWRP